MWGFNQALNTILQLKRICKGQFEIDFTTIADNITYLQNFDIPVVKFSYSLVDKFLAKFSLNEVWQIIQKYIKLLAPLKKLIKHDCDLVYFVNPTGSMFTLQKLNYIATVWDLCHETRQVSGTVF